MVNIRTVLKRLKEHRMIFHNERDFQFALAWCLQVEYPTAQIRLEYPAFTGENKFVDIWVVQDAEFTAIELKYIPAAFTATVNGEPFSLSQRDAPDQQRYLYVQDICRLERLHRDNTELVGYAIMLSNETAMWNEGSTSKGQAFKIHEGQMLGGTLKWACGTKHGTMGGKKNRFPLTLEGSYPMHWIDFGTVSGDEDDDVQSKFRYPVTRVGGR